MKRKFRLLTIPSAVVACFTPAMALSSCGTKASAVAKTTIDEFKKLTIIPHSSDKFLKEVPYEAGNVWNLSCYLRERISSIIGKNVFQDKYGNLVFDVEANDKSLENAPKIAIQAHMDMVFAYDPEKIEFIPDPRVWKIALVEDTVNGKKVLHSDKYRTSIGADDGMGVAQILALIQHKEIKHGHLRFILTNCEENGSQGGSLLFNETYPDVLKDYYYLINLDMEDVGDVCVACSGAVGSYYYINSDHEAQPGEGYVPKDASNFIKVTIDDFPGGHSGIDMPKRIDSALRFMNGVLVQLNGEANEAKKVRLHSISTPGSSVYNSICKTCEVVFCVDDWKTLEFTEIKKFIEDAVIAIKEDRKKIAKEVGDRREYTGKFDPAQYDKITCKITQTEPKYNVALSAEDTAKILKLQSEEELWYGVYNWPTDEEMTQLTGEQTSANIGPAVGKVTSNFNFEYTLSTYSRSSEAGKVSMFFKMNEEAAKEAKAKWKYDAYFNPWHVDANKKLFNLCKQGWVNAGVDASKVTASRTHGGLECSFWHEAMEKDPSKAGKTAIVAYGPQLHDVHKFTETVELDTVETCVNTTIYILEHANELAI